MSVWWRTDGCSRTLNVLAVLASSFHHIGGHDLAADQVVGEDGLELGHVLEQLVHGAGRQLGESIVGGREDWAWAKSTRFCA